MVLAHAVRGEVIRKGASAAAYESMCGCRGEVTGEMMK